MKKQMIKGFAITTLMMAFAFIAAAVPANAQSTQQISAKVPFEFSVGDKTLPAGEYHVRSITRAADVLSIQNDKTLQSIGRFTMRIRPNEKDTRVRLVFHRYGDQYFLSEVWGGYDGSGRQLVESKKEKNARRSAGTLAAVRYETVEIVALVVR
jgi:hypothetical protein